MTREFAHFQMEHRADRPLIHYCDAAYDASRRWTWDKRESRPGNVFRAPNWYPGLISRAHRSTERLGDTQRPSASTGGGAVSSQDSLIEPAHLRIRLRYRHTARYMRLRQRHLQRMVVPAGSASSLNRHRTCTGICPGPGGWLQVPRGSPSLYCPRVLKKVLRFGFVHVQYAVVRRLAACAPSTPLVEAKTRTDEPGSHPTGLLRIVLAMSLWNASLEVIDCECLYILSDCSTLFQRWRLS